MVDEVHAVDCDELEFQDFHSCPWWWIYRTGMDFRELRTASPRQVFRYFKDINHKEAKTTEGIQARCRADAKPLVVGHLYVGM